MMNTTISRKIENSDEIMTHLTQAALKQERAYVWNRNEEGQVRVNEKVRIIKVNERKQVRIEFDEEMDFMDGQEVFFALDNGTMVFKSYVINCMGRKVLLSLPNMAKGKERRRSPRKYFKLEEKIDFEMDIPIGGISKRSTAYLLDLSEHGMCLSFTEETVKRLEVNKTLTIIHGSKGVSYKRCIVRSIRVYRGASMGRDVLYAVGLEFES